jgi:cell division septation protein DedD
MRPARRALLVQHRNVAVIHPETTMPKTLKSTRTRRPKAIPPSKRAAPAKTTKAKGAAQSPAKTAAAAPRPKSPKRSKQSQLIALLQSPAGATIEQMTRATGWQAHTVRGTISGSLRKRLGLKVICGGDAGARVYRIVAAP